MNTPPPCRFESFTVGVVAMIAILTVIHPSNAWSLGECRFSSHIASPRRADYEFRINADAATAFIDGVGNPLDTTDALRGVIAGAAVWSDNARSGTFKYGGTTTDTGVSAADCASKTYALVKFTDGCYKNLDDTRAITYAAYECSGQTRFMIEIFSRPRVAGSSTTCDNKWAWGTGQIAANEKDLWSVVAHEFGHTLRLKHSGESGESAPPTAPAAVMYYRLPSGEVQQRYPYEWDMKCVEDGSLARTPAILYRYHNSAGGFGAETYANDASPNSSVGVKLSGFSFDGWTLAGWGFGAPGFFKNGVGSFSGVPLPYITKYESIGPANAVWRDDPDKNVRVFYSKYTGTSANGWNALQQVRYLRTTDDFGTYAQDRLRYCNHRSAYDACTDKIEIFSAHRLSVAYFDDSVDRRSVTAWTQQTRLNDGSDGRVFVAAGFVAQGTLAQPKDLAIRSSVGPAVVCQNDDQSIESCRVLYVDADDAQFRVRSQALARFRYTGSYGVHIEFAKSGSSTLVANGALRSANALTAWWNGFTGRYYVAARTMNVNQPIAVYSSSDGVSWSVASSSLGYSNSAPSAVGYWRADNYLVYHRF